MAFIVHKTNHPWQTRKARHVKPEKIEEGLKNNTLKMVSRGVYEQVNYSENNKKVLEKDSEKETDNAQTYLTRDLTADGKRSRGRPRKLKTSN